MTAVDQLFAKALELEPEDRMELAERLMETCDAPDPGYIVKFSEIFRVSADSVQVHLAAERYNTPTSAALELMRFEKAYQLVGKGTTWRVARAGRVTQATR